MDEHSINEYGWVIITIIIISTLLSVVPGVTKAFDTMSETHVYEQIEGKDEIVSTYNNEKISTSNGLLVSIGKENDIDVVARFNDDYSVMIITKNGSYEDRKSNSGLMRDNLASYLTGKGIDIKKIKSVTITMGVVNIGANAFSGFTNLTGIDIPASVTSISTGAFSNCSKLQNIAYSDTQANWNEISKAGDWNLNNKVSCEK